MEARAPDTTAGLFHLPDRGGKVQAGLPKMQKREGFLVKQESSERDQVDAGESFPRSFHLPKQARRPDDASDGHHAFLHEGDDGGGENGHRLPLQGLHVCEEDLRHHGCDG